MSNQPTKRILESDDEMSLPTVSTSSDQTRDKGKGKAKELRTSTTPSTSGPSTSAPCKKDKGKGKATQPGTSTTPSTSGQSTLASRKKDKGKSSSSANTSSTYGTQTSQKRSKPNSQPSPVTETPEESLSQISLNDQDSIYDSGDSMLDILNDLEQDDDEEVQSESDESLMDLLYEPEDDDEEFHDFLVDNADDDSDQSIDVVGSDKDDQGPPTTILTVYGNAAQLHNTHDINRASDNDNIIADLPAETPFHYYFFGLLGRRRLSPSRTKKYRYGLPICHGVGIDRTLEDDGYTQSIIWPGDIVLKGGNVRTTHVRWNCSTTQVCDRFLEYGLPSSNILRTIPDKVKKLFDIDVNLIMFFWGLVSADGYVNHKIKEDGVTRKQLSVEINMTDKDLPQILNIIREFANMTTLHEYDLRNTESRIPYKKVRWKLWVPSKVAAVLIQEYEEVCPTINAKAAFAKRLLDLVPQYAKSLRLQRKKWTEFYQELEIKYDQLFHGPEGDMWKSIIMSIARDLYVLQSEVLNSLYQAVEWEPLTKPEDFDLHRFMMRVLQLNSHGDPSLEVKALVNYIEVCKYRFVNMPAIDDKRMAPLHYKCQVDGCAAYFVSWQRLSRHVLREHEPEKWNHFNAKIQERREIRKTSIYTCETCNQSIQGYKEYKMHVLKEHNPDGYANYLAIRNKKHLSKDVYRLMNRQEKPGKGKRRKSDLNEKMEEGEHLSNDANPEKAKENDRRSKQKYKEKAKETGRIYHQNNKEKSNEYKRMYYEKNKEKVKENYQKNAEKINARRRELYQCKKAEKLKEESADVDQ
ncbi:hypothetical protein Unana1_04415 [Umbelopsis nana]